MSGDMPEERHARIMIECGCCIEDVAVTFGWTLAQTIRTVSPALKSNLRERKRVAKIVRKIRLTPVIRNTHKVASHHKGTSGGVRGQSPVTLRRAA